MTYEATLDYLFTQLPMYQRDGAAAMKKDLTNTQRLLEWLGNPHERLRCIHVAGTNGKGTTCHLIAAALQAHGYRVGVYTSPHYKDFRERIKINGAFITEKAVTDFVTRLRESGPDIQPSFFEITVAMAFEYFARESPDWCVIEVGLGGRLDSTNVITPLVSVITNIGYDHTQFLGETLPEIAGEKAGIIKPGVPVVIGETHLETEPVFRRKAAELGADLYFADEVFYIDESYVRDDPRLSYFRVQRTIQGNERILQTDLSGPHLKKNVLTALAALNVLANTAPLALRYENINRGWSSVRESTYYLGRWQTLRQANPLCIVDSAHNAEGLRPVLERLQSYQLPLHLVIGFVNDKDLGKALPLFPTAATYYFVKADIPRGLPAAELQAAAAQHGLQGEAYPSVAEGYAAAQAAAGTGGLVFVGGSIFVVAEVI